MICDTQLIKLSSQGFWPGPSESEHDFLSRIEATQNSGLLLDPVILNIKSKIDQITQEHYGFRVDKLFVSFDDNGLAVWEGAALWIEEDSGSKIPYIQLKRRFKKGKWLFYRLDEVVSHELFHAARIAYDEPKYEEILAYSSSPRAIQRHVAPLFQNPRESLFFVVLLFVSCSLDLFFFDFSFFYLFFVAYSLFLSLRLYLRKKRVKHVTSKLQALFGSKVKACGLLCRLTDKEIDGFSKISSEEIKEYFMENSKNNIRLMAIRSTFFTLQ